MDDWCFVHAADLHLDTPFSGMQADAPALAALLRDASLDALDRLVALAIERRAAFVVLAGDLYDGAERGLRAQVRFHEALVRLDDAGIAAFVVHGNHDPLEEGWQAIDTWPQRVTVFGADEVTAVPVELDGRTLATVHGISYATREERANLARRFARTEASGLHVGVLHATVGHPSGHEPYAPCTLDDLRAARLDYWALGHVHRREILHRGREQGDPWVVYSGNTQGRSPKPSERGAKGCYVVTVSPTAPGSPICEPEFVPLDAVRFETVTVDATDLTELPALRTQLEAAARRLHEEAEGRALILRGRVTGTSPLHDTLLRPGATDQLLATLRDGARATAPPRWWDRLEVATWPEVDREVLATRQDFAGELVRRVDALGDDEAARQLVEQECEELRRRLFPQPRLPAAAELLAAAERRALQLLEREDG